jgi:NhaA family Na+:H+ antiporter
VDWKGVTVVGAVAGIGFTMAIFVAGLAFDDPGRLGIAKLAVLVSSGVAAVVTLLGARLLLPREPSPEIAAVTVDQAERSTDY